MGFTGREVLQNAEKRLQAVCLRVASQIQERANADVRSHRVNRLLLIGLMQTGTSAPGFGEEHVTSRLNCLNCLERETIASLGSGYRVRIPL